MDYYSSYKKTPVPRISDDKILEPIPQELEVLEQAKVYLDNSSYREVASWVTKKTGRYISHVGLLKAINRY